jgi:hypothetical protein
LPEETTRYLPAIYMNTARQSLIERNYYVLATAGGGSGLRGPQYGQFDHLTLVTMVDAKPKVANIAIDGIIDDNPRNTSP